MVIVLQGTYISQHNENNNDEVIIKLFLLNFFSIKAKIYSASELLRDIHNYMKWKLKKSGNAIEAWNLAFRKRNFIIVLNVLKDHREYAAATGTEEIGEQN